MVDFIILFFILGYCLYVIMRIFKKKKTGCCEGACASCHGCQDVKHLKDIYHQEQSHG